MKHRATPQFWHCFERLPENTQSSATRNFDLLKNDLHHPSLHFKRVNNLYSVRIGLHYRALAIEEAGDLVWFWIGSHADYDRLIK